MTNETKSQKRKRKFVGVAACLIIVTIIITSVLVYAWIQQHPYSKDEPLPPQERWQIIDIDYNNKTGDYATYFTLKYLGENTAKNVEVCVQYSSKSYHLVKNYDLDGEFHKDDTRTIECDGFFEDLSIIWDISHYTTELLYADFELPRYWD